ncbi:hypothetical protein PPERSA_00515 [Pseudocohnilembus persalinus]|uniref:FCH domain-containing protein n=1 Tax=Pseudocohnilembus persalinus TaxID=266149 RepID=A0A0V0QHV3_PSEPJ|nr:hypothetical protein PPERSA_00515 [Pseudocohnilembus persalinus]|eukprot:KRX01805.1 hypothetical protein PPERSA_00515 [Pseudocohnilembus persalinus]
MATIGYNPDIIEKNDYLQKKFEEKQIHCEELMYILKQRAELEEYYSRNLEKMSFQLAKVIPGKDQIKSIVQSLQAFFTIQSEQAKEFASNIKEHVISEFQEFSQLQQQDLKNQQFAGRDHFNTLKQYMNKFDDFRSQYIKISQLLNQQGKSNNAISEKSYQEKQKIEQDFKQFIDQYNQYIKQYFIDNSKLTENYVALEISRREKIKDTIMKYLVFVISQIRNLQYDVDQITKKIEVLDIQKDLDFIKKPQLDNDKKPLLTQVNFENYKYYMDYTIQNGSGFLKGTPNYFQIQDKLQQKQVQQLQQQQKENAQSLSQKQISQHQKPKKQESAALKWLFGIDDVDNQNSQQNQNQQNQQNSNLNSQNLRKNRKLIFENQSQQSEQKQVDLLNAEQVDYMQQESFQNSQTSDFATNLFQKAIMGYEINKYELDTIKSFLKTQSERKNFAESYQNFFLSFIENQQDQNYEKGKILQKNQNMQEIQLSSNSYTQNMKILYTLFEMCTSKYDISPILIVYHSTSFIYKLIKLPDEDKQVYEKIYLQNGLQGHPLFSNWKYWEGYLKKKVVVHIQEYEKNEQNTFMSFLEDFGTSSQVKKKQKQQFIQNKILQELQILFSLRISLENIKKALWEIFKIITVDEPQLIQDMEISYENFNKKYNQKTQQVITADDVKQNDIIPQQNQKDNLKQNGQNKQQNKQKSSLTQNENQNEQSKNLTNQEEYTLNQSLTQQQYLEKQYNNTVQQMNQQQKDLLSDVVDHQDQQIPQIQQDFNQSSNQFNLNINDLLLEDNDQNQQFWDKQKEQNQQLIQKRQEVSDQQLNNQINQQKQQEQNQKNQIQENNSQEISQQKQNHSQQSDKKQNIDYTDFSSFDQHQYFS